MHYIQDTYHEPDLLIDISDVFEQRMKAIEAYGSQFYSGNLSGIAPSDEPQTYISTPDFLEAVSPSVAIISAGFENSFGHPHPTVLARLTERHTAILRTDQDGLSTVRSDGRKLSFDSMLWHPQSPADIFNWALAVNPE